MNLKSTQTAFRDGGLIGFVLLIISLIAGCDGKPKPAFKASTTTNLKRMPIQDTMDLGVLFQGESIRLNRWIQNQADKPIRINQTESSCECTTLTVSDEEIPPGGKVLAQVSYDGSREPDFTGSIQIRVALKSAEGQQIGLITVPVEVIPPQ